jgi:hypothetical protein
LNLIRGMLTRLAIVAAASVSALFSSYDVVSLQLEAPFNELFDHARTDDTYRVTGRLSFTENGEPVTIDGVTLTLRGHTSRRESECRFPKLKVDIPKGSKRANGMLAGMGSIKIGTHCGEAPDEGVTVKFGRLPNEHSALREAFVYRLLDAVGVPALKARPARITYVYADPRTGQTPRQDQPLVRHALLLEDSDAAIARLGGRREIAENEFTNARDQFSTADTARLALAEAMLGNFDWCLKMTADDAYRCDARHPLWNIVAAAVDGGRARPLMYDFDVSGVVTGRHPWFKDVLTAGFVQSRSQPEVEVLAQVQRTRSLFSRSDLNAARAEFVAKKSAAYQALDRATLDAAGKENAKRYLDSFFAAIESDTAFYRPVVVATGAKLYADTNRTPLCGASGDVPVGTPVSAPMKTDGGMVQVMVLDALWHWSPPTKCPAVREGPVWIEASSIGADFPKQ